MEDVEIFEALKNVPFYDIFGPNETSDYSTDRNMQVEHWCELKRGKLRKKYQNRRRDSIIRETRRGKAGRFVSPFRLYYSLRLYTS